MEQSYKKSGRFILQLTTVKSKENYHVKNLHLWAEEHEDLLPVSEKTGDKVSARTFERELRRIKGTELGTETKQAVHKDYYGWTLKESDK